MILFQFGKYFPQQKWYVKQQKLAFTSHGNAY